VLDLIRSIADELLCRLPIGDVTDYRAAMPPPSISPCCLRFFRGRWCSCLGQSGKQCLTSIMTCQAGKQCLTRRAGSVPSGRARKARSVRCKPRNQEIRRLRVSSPNPKTILDLNDFDVPPVVKPLFPRRLQDHLNYAAMCLPLAVCDRPAIQVHLRLNLAWRISSRCCEP